MPRTRMKSGGSREKKTRHLPTRRRSSPGRSLRDFTSPWPVAAKRTRAASIRAWTTRSRRAPLQVEKRRGGSQPEPASDFVQGDIVARFRTGQIQLGRSLGIEDFLLTQFRQKRNGHLHLTVRKGIHKRLKAAAIGGHVSIITSRAASHLRANIKRSGWSPDPCWQSAGTAFGNWPYSHPDPRLQAAWDDHVVCGAELPGRQNPVPDRDAPHACGMAALPETDRPGNAPRPATPPHRGQLCDAQTRKSAQLAEAAPANRYALHADGQFLDEPGGALLRGPDGRLRAGRELRKRASSDRSDRRVSGGASHSC